MIAGISKSFETLETKQNSLFLSRYVFETLLEENQSKRLKRRWKQKMMESFLQTSDYDDFWRARAKKLNKNKTWWFQKYTHKFSHSSMNNQGEEL